MECIITGRPALAGPINFVLNALGVGGDYEPVDAKGLSAAVVYVPSRSAMVAQTHAAAPLFRTDVEAGALRYAVDVVLLRIGATHDRAVTVTADIALAAPPCAAWVENDLTLWFDGTSAWLVPDTFGPSVAISVDGFTLSLTPPYETLAERNSGIDRAARTIAGLHLVEA